MIFIHKRDAINEDLQINQVDVKITNQAKYHGLILDHKLTFTKHITNIIQKANAAISMLYLLICRNRHISIKNKLIIYKLCIRPILLYACPVWSNTSQSNYNRLQTLQNKCLRMILNLPYGTSSKFLHERLQMPTIKNVSHEIAMKFFNTLNDKETLKDVAKTTNQNPCLKHKVLNQIIINQQPKNISKPVNDIKYCKVNILYKRIRLS